jgi:hypothetical protein
MIRKGSGSWLSFEYAATEIELHLGSTWGAARKALRDACSQGQLKTQRRIGEPADVWDIDFWPWLDAKHKRTPRSQTLVLRAIAELNLPSDTPTPALLQAICKWHTDHGSKPPSRDTILRATGRRR